MKRLLMAALLIGGGGIGAAAEAQDDFGARPDQLLPNAGPRDRSVNVLYYSEQDLGPSAYAQALIDLEWDTLATFTSSATDFATFLDAGGWTHVISNHSATSAPAGFEDALAGFALANPDVPVLISDWRINNPQPYLGALGFAYGVGADYESFAAVPDELFDGLPPAAIVDPGWGSLYAVETAEATQIATSSLEGGAVQQNGNWFFNGFLGDVFSDPSLGSAYIQRELLANTGVTVMAVSPAMHDFEDGSPIVIIGSGFSSSLEVTINGLQLTDLTLINSTGMTGLVPANPVGIYDLVVKDSVSQITQATLPSAVEYIIGKLPPPEDVSAVRVATGVQLNWSNPTFNDLIRVKRNGVEIDVLPGDATEYLDYLGAPPTSSIPYEIVAEAGVRSSTAAETTCAPLRQECLPFLADGASGKEYGEFFPLPAESEARLCFHLDNNVNGLGFRVALRRINNVGKLWARIGTVDDPPTVLDDVEFAAIPAALSTYSMATSGVELTPGDYVLGIYTTEYEPGDPPGEPGVPSFELMPDAFYLHPDPPWCASDYPYAPLVDIWPFCENVPPAVTDITQSLPGGFEVVDPDRLRAGGEEESTFLRTLTAEAEDSDGTIDHFIWIIGYQGELDCDPNGEDPDRWPCSASATSAGNSILHEFPHRGMWKVTVIAEDDAGDRGVADRVFPIGPHDPSPPCGEGPWVDHQEPATEDEDWPLRYIPNVAGTYPAAVSTANQKFSAQVTPADCSPPEPPGGLVPVQSVEMELLDPDTLIGLGPIIAEEDPNGFLGPPSYGQLWGAPFNMGALPQTQLVELRVTATGEDEEEGFRAWAVPLCMLPEIFDYDAHDVNLIETELLYRGDPKPRYDLKATIPDFKILDEDILVPLVNVSLSNVIDAHVTFSEYLEDKWWTPQTLEGRFQATLLDYDLFPTKEFELNLEDLDVEYACDDFEIKYERLNIPIYQSDAMTWEILPRTTLWNGFVGPVHVKVSASLDVGMDFEVSADVKVFVRAYQEGGDPAVEIILVSNPTVNAWATGELRVEVYWGLASASVRLRPSISVCLPIIITGEAPPIPLGLGVSLDWGFVLSLDVNIRGCAFGCISSGWITLFNEPFGAGCGGARQAVSPRNDEEASDLMYPSIAISPDGSSSMVVFVNNCVAAPGEYLPEVYYSLDSGAGYSLPDPILSAPNEFTERDTTVAFTSNDQAIAVWTQGLLTHAEESALPQTPTGANTGFKNSDVYFAAWDGTVGTWDAPQPLHEDAAPLIPDGRPAVAPFVDDLANPNAAWVVWVRSDNEDMIYEDAGEGHVAGDANLSGMSIYAHKIWDGAPSGDLVKISAGDETEPAADIQPTIALSPSGEVALAVWVRDEDSDFDTPEDRFLICSVWSAEVWQPPTAITDPTELPGVLMPSVALSSDDDGMLVFTVRDVDIDGSPVMYEGNKDVVYTMEIIDTIFQSATPLQHRPARNPDAPIKRLTNQVLVTRPVYGRQPQVRYLDSSTVAVVFRSFDGFGPEGGDGEIGIATIDLSQPEAKWCYARDLTDDDHRDWDIAAAVDPSGMIRTVRDRYEVDVDPDEFCGLTFNDIIPCIPDLMVDQVRLSYPHTPPGSQVTLTAVLRNNGLCTSQDTSPQLLHIGRVIDDVFEPITDPIPFAFDGVVPEETMTFSHTILAAPIETTHLRVIAEPIEGETDIENNSADVILGVLPPTDLQCTPILSNPRPTVRLVWENAEHYDSIFVYRNGRLLAEVRADSTAYLDTTVGPGDHEWSVRGKIGRALSDPAGAVCATTVVSGDFDGDRDVDLDDYAVFADCMAGPDMPPSPTLPDVTDQDCLDAFDFLLDGDVDLDDFMKFEEVFTGV